MQRQVLPSLYDQHLQLADGIITGTKVVVPHQEWDNFLGSQ